MQSVPFVFCLFVIKEKPINYPNAIAEKLELKRKITMKEYFIELW